MNIGHKLHFDGYLTFAFTGFAAPTIDIKTKMLGAVAPDLELEAGLDRLEGVEDAGELALVGGLDEGVADEADEEAVEAGHAGRGRGDLGAGELEAGHGLGGGAAEGGEVPRLHLDAGVQDEQF